MAADTDRLILGYKLCETNIPADLHPLIEETVDSYRKHHNDLSAVYLFGSVALGDWKDGISDLDTIGIAYNSAETQADYNRRQDLLGIGNRCAAITFIDSAILGNEDIQSLESLGGADTTAGYLSKLALTGLCLWGEPSDFSEYVPTVNEMAYGRTRRVEALMNKYRSGNLIEAFRLDQRLLTRSCAKAAMRVLSGVTILRGAPYHSSPYRTAEQIDIYSPEASTLSRAAIEIVLNPIVSPNEAMVVADKSVELFYKLFPEK